MNTSHAQTVKAWDNAYGGDGFDALHDMIEHSDGSIVFLGTQSSNASGDVSQTSNGFSDFWLVKIAPDGTKIWDASYGGDIIDNGRSLQETSDGGYIMTGYSSSSISGDKTEASFGGCITCYDYWVVKADSDGVLEWEETFSADGEDRPFTIQETVDGGYIVGGYSNSDMSGDKSENSKGDYDYWVIKMDATGTLEWERTIGGNEADRLYKIIQTTDDGYLLGGFSASDISGDKTSNSEGGFDYWIVKLDPMGTIQWDRTFGGDQEDRLYDMVVSTDGGFLLGGYSFSDISGQKSTASRGERDYWLLKVDFSGNKLWDRTYGGSGRDQFFSITKNAAHDSYLLSGLSRSNASGEKSEDQVGFSDYWFVHIDEQGDLLKDKTFGGLENDNLEVGLGLSDGSIVLGGFSASGISGDKTEANVGQNDNWLIKLDCQDAFSLPNDTIICRTDTLLLDATSPNCSNCCNYEWNDGILLPVRNDIIDASTSFQVTVTDGYLCSQSDTINIDVFSLPVLNLDDQYSICDGDSILIDAGNAGDDFLWSTGETSQSIYLKNQGNYSVTVTNGNFCSSIKDFELIVYNSVTTNLNTSICAGDSLFLAGAFQLMDGIFQDTLSSFRSCDSIIITNLSIRPIDTSYTFTGSCSPVDTGTFVVPIVNMFGCIDYRIDRIDLYLSDTTFLPPLFTCDPSLVGIDVTQETNQYNCDSIVVTNTILLPSSGSTQFTTTCDPASAGISFDTIPNFLGCDSIITTQTTLLPSTTSLAFESTCDPAMAGVSFDTIPNFFGCDSIITTNTTLLPTTTGMRTATTCLLSEAGISFDTIPNFFGCDSIITVNTTLLQSSTITLFTTSCDPAEVGTQLDTIPNFVGCDSIITTITNLNPTDSIFLNFSSCDSSLVGMTIDTLVNQFSCDSFVFTTVTQLPNFYQLIENTSCDPSLVGTSLDTFSNQFGCDSIIEVVTSLLPNYLILDTLGTCDPSLVGTVSDTLMSQSNCDSIIQTTFFLLPSDTSYFNFFSCDPTQAGMDTLTYTNSANCDSLEIRTTIYIPPDTTYVPTIITCIPDEVGMDTIPLSNQFGCDSIVIRETILEQFSFTTRTTPVTCFGNRDGLIEVDSVWEGVSPYLYALEDGTFQASPIFSNLTARSYLLRIQDADGCEVEGIITVSAPAEFQISLGDDQIVQQGENFDLTATSDQAIQSFVWDTISPVPCPTCLTQSINATESAIYGITAISPEGCLAYDQIRILVSKERFVYIPTAFSPDDNSTNDLMRIYVGRGVKTIKRFSIYNRWGAQVYEINNVDPSAVDWGWDGRLAGEKLSPDVFVFYAEVIFQDDQLEIYKGDFVLMR
ncbi:MAG: gliding motility-associated C-terminal domain-containing protein [Saprospiraceae bacterium]